jgi:DNA invertase Pin-like site-specific DNA recombinase
MQKKQKTAIYCRTANHSDEAITTQEMALRDYAIKNGYNDVTVYADNGSSSLDLERPAFTKMKTDICDGTVSIVLVKDLSRLARNLFHIRELIHIFHEFEIELVSLSDGGVVDMTGAKELADAFVALAKKNKGKRSKKNRT